MNAQKNTTVAKTVNTVATHMGTLPTVDSKKSETLKKNYRTNGTYF